MTLAKAIATCLGIGYIQKGAGTIAALFCCVIWNVASVGSLPIVTQLLILAVVFAIGTWSATVVEKEWGHDSNHIVIDEVLGMGIALLYLPSTMIVTVLAFVLFRFFDIVKPLFIRKMEKLPSGWGVMMDDVLAGIYANVLVQALLYFQFIKSA